MTRRGGRKRRGARGAEGPHRTDAPEGDPDLRFAEARRLLDAGKYKAAMEQAGYGLRLDLERPDGYLILGELNLLTGDPVEARRNFRAAARCAGTSPDVLLLGAVAAFLLGDLSAAAQSARRAYLENVYLAAALSGEEVPDFGLVHGIPEASPGHAVELAGRMRPLLASEEGAARFLRAVSSSRLATEDRERFVSIAKKLQREPRIGARQELQKALDELRDPERIAATSEEMLAALESGYGCGEPPGGSFEV
jgi:tetratricopeptide (TPR) repeat protein